MAGCKSTLSGEDFYGAYDAQVRLLRWVWLPPLGLGPSRPYHRQMIAPCSPWLLALPVQSASAHGVLYLLYLYHPLPYSNLLYLALLY